MKKLIIVVFALLSIWMCASAQNKHYAGEISIGGVSSLNEHFGAGIDVQTVHGINFGKGSFVGLGMGLLANRPSADKMIVPVFLKAKQSFKFCGAFNPYLAMAAGLTVVNDMKVTPYFAPEAGLTYKWVGLFVRFTFANTSFKYTYHLPEQTMTYTGENRRLLSAGLMISFGK